MKQPGLRKKIGARITALRNGRDIKDHAEACNVSYQYMYKLEAGKQGYEIESIAKICKGNNITLAQFFEGIPLD